MSEATDDASLREALRLSEERVDLALDAAHAGMFDMDLQTSRIYGSTRYRSMLRLPDGPIDAAMVAQLIHVNDRVPASTPWDLPEVNGRVVWRARVQPIGTTEWRTVETHARVLRDEHGSPIRMIGVMQDVTETVAQLDALRESERRLSEAQRVAGIGSWSWNPSTGDIVWTDELFRIFDLARDGRAGPTFDEYLARLMPADQERLQQAIDLALRDGTAYHFEHSVQLGDGSLRRVRSYGGTLRDEQGAIVRLVGTAQDVTEQWALSERVRRSEARYALAAEGTSDGIWSYDLGAGIGEVSPRLLDLLGRPHDGAWVSLDWIAEVVPAADLALLREAVRRHLEEGAPLEVELQLRTTSRGLRWFRIRGRAVREADGHAVRLAGALSDVTEQRALQARLQHDSKMNALGTLAGGIAHDFNNLIAAMLGFAQLASDELPADSPAHVHLTQVVAAARRSRDLVREILAFSRPDEPRRSAVDLAQLVRETVQLLQSTLPPGGALRATGDEVPRLVLGDPTQLQRVLLNLCANSIDAIRSRADAGVVEVHLTCDLLDANAALALGVTPGHYVKVQVADNGIGIPDEALARVFDPFFTTKPVGEGTGLGLSVVHGIVMAADGAVTVDSIQHVGTTVAMWLPQLASLVASAPEHVDGDSATGATLAASRARVAVVDDDPAVGRLLQVALQREHHDVDLFTHAADALESMASSTARYDCIVTDFAMPELNGIDLLVQLRAAGVEAPAILVTGFADGASLDMRQRAGVLTVLEKPIELRTFVRVVHLAMARG